MKVEVDNSPKSTEGSVPKNIQTLGDERKFVWHFLVKRRIVVLTDGRAKSKEGPSMAKVRFDPCNKKS